MKILNNDCLTILPEILNKSIDLILIDPPYIISKNSGYVHNAPEQKEYIAKYGNHKIDFGEWDKIDLNLEYLLSHFFRILKDGGTLLMFYDVWKMQEIKSIAEKNGFKQARLCCWNKTNPVPINSQLNYLTNAKEYFVTFVKKSKPTFNSKYDNGDYYAEILDSDTYFYPICHGKERLKHPTQKPLALIEALVKKHSNDGDMVLDCFAGTGTTGNACKNLNRDYFLCEKEKDYYDLILKRLNA